MLNGRGACDILLKKSYIKEVHDNFNTMRYPIFQVDAFADELFTGNPAAVVVLCDWVDKALMQKVAAENSLSETAFIVRMPDMYEIRWFTPTMEVDLCGHATLAAGFVVLNKLEPNRDKVSFISEKSGILEVKKNGAFFEMDFPADELSEYDVEECREIYEFMGKKPKEAYFGRTDCMFVYEKEKDIQQLNPNFYALGDVDYRGIIVTAPGEHVDFVSRFFAPQSGIPEDPVTGSSHTSLVPYWHKRTGDVRFTAKQLSERTGMIHCSLSGDRVKLSGKAKLYMQGEINLK